MNRRIPNSNVINLPKPQREIAGRWKAGQSGNPGGRPKAVKEIQELARSYAPEALERLAFWMRTDDSRASPSACIALLNRGLGMPMQQTELMGPGGGPVNPPSLTVNFAKPKLTPAQS